MGFKEIFSRKTIYNFGDTSLEVIRAEGKTTHLYTLEVDFNNIVISVGSGGTTKANTRSVKVFEDNQNNLKILLLQSFFKYPLTGKNIFIRPLILAVFTDAFIEKYGRTMVEFSVMVMVSTFESDLYAVNEKREGIIGAARPTGRSTSFVYVNPTKAQTERVLGSFKDLLKG